MSGPMERSPLEESLDAFGWDAGELDALLREPNPLLEDDGLCPVEPMDPFELNAYLEDWDNADGWRWDL